VTPKRGDRAAPPPATGEYELRFATTAAAEGWEDLCRQAPGGMRRAWEHIRADPRARERPGRQPPRQTLTPKSWAMPRRPEA
jgi:hypothetical protein